MQFCKRAVSSVDEGYWPFVILLGFPSSKPTSHVWEIPRLRRKSPLPSVEAEKARFGDDLQFRSRAIPPRTSVALQASGLAWH